MTSLWPTNRLRVLFDGHGVGVRSDQHHPGGRGGVRFGGGGGDAGGTAPSKMLCATSLDDEQVAVTLGLGVARDIAGEIQRALEVGVLRTGICAGTSSKSGPPKQDSSAPTTCTRGVLSAKKPGSKVGLELIAVAPAA